MSRKPPTVSVVMSVHNGERFLQEAVGSILAQTWSDFEFIVVDDASTDRTPAILDALHDPRIVRLRNEANLGLTKSLNRGLQQARGRYIARLDADDLSEPQRLARQVEYLEGHPEIVVLGTWTTEIDENGREIGALEIVPDPDFIAWELTRRNVVYQSSVLMRREQVLRLGGYDPAFPYAQDHDLWTRVIRAGGKVALLPEKLTRYRRSGGQITRTRAAEQDRCGLAVRQRYLQWLLDTPVEIAAIDAMRRILRRDAPESIADLPAGLYLLHRVCRVLARRSGPAGRRAVRQTIYEILRWHAFAALYQAGDPALSLRMLGAAVRRRPAQLLNLGIWRQAAGIARGAARSVRSPQPQFTGPRQS